MQKNEQMLQVPLFVCCFMQCCCSRRAVANQRPPASDADEMDESSASLLGDERDAGSGPGMTGRVKPGMPEKGRAAYDELFVSLLKIAYNCR